MHQTRPLLSLACTLSGMFVLGISDNLIQIISQDSSLWLFQAARSGMALPMMLLLALLGLGTLRAKRPMRVFARNFFTATALLIYFGSLAFLPIGVAVAGLFTAPIFVLVFSVLFRAEKIGIWRWAAVVAGFAGALLIVWPDDGRLTVVSLLPIVAGAFYAVGAIGTRAWCEGESVLVMNFGYFMILGVYGLIGVLVLQVWPVAAPPGVDGWLSRGWVSPDTTMLLVTLGQAVGSVLGMGLLTRGYQLGEASYVAINEYSLIVFASLFGWLIWGQYLTLTALAGVALVVLSGSIIVLRARG